MRAKSYQRVLRRYAGYAPTYDQRWGRYTAATVTRALEAVPREGGRSLLDVACGTGALIEMIRRRRPDLRMLGVDLSPDMLEQAKRRMSAAAHHGNTIAWKVGQAEQLPAEDGSFDILTCTNAFHLVRDGRAALTEFRRVLAPGGMMILVDWCRDFLPMRWLEAVENVTDPHGRHVYHLDELVGLVEEVGFAISAADRFKVTWFWGLMRIVANAPTPQRHEIASLDTAGARTTGSSTRATIRDRQGAEMTQG